MVETHQKLWGRVLQTYLHKVCILFNIPFIHLLKLSISEKEFNENVKQRHLFQWKDLIARVD